MRILLSLLLLLSAASMASATSYAFTLENSVAQSAIIAEVEVTGAKVYVSDFNDFEEVEVECKILTLYKGPAGLKSFRVRYYGKSKPVATKALVFAFRPSIGNEIRTFNGSSGFVGAEDNRFSFGFEKLKTELASIQKSGSAKPMEGFSEGTLDGSIPLESGTLTFTTAKD
jgi:hypothetical protein